MRRPKYFFAWLLTTVLVVAVPLLSIHAWTLYRNLQTTQEQAYQEVQAKSQSAAKAVESTLDGAQRLLTFLAGRDEVRSLEPSRCSDFLAGFENVSPLYGVVSVLSTSGQVRCSSVGPSSPASPGAGNSEWLSKATASAGSHLGKPTVGINDQRPVLPLSLSVRDSGGAQLGIAVVSVDLKQLEELLVNDWPAKGGVLALVDEDFLFLIRSPDSSKWLGRSASNAVKSMRRDAPDKVLKAVGVDGVERVFASSDVSGHRLRVVASIPASVVMVGAHTEIKRGLLVAGLALLLAGVLAIFGARALARPVRSLAGTVRDFSAGLADTRADESLPGEFRELAVEMNSMHLARRQSEAMARASQAQVLRLSRFYEATSRTNQAIVRLKAENELYETICEVCVQTGQASMAWIGLIQGYRLTPVAWAGPAKRYTQEFDLDLGPLSQRAGGPFGASVLEGQMRVVNDYVNDARTVAFRENAVPFDVRASAIVPFSRAGIVVGTLNLYASEPEFFDADLVRLLEEMAADISFALDNFAKAALHAQTQAELVKRATQLSGIVESAMDPIITIDTQQRILVFNSAASRVFKVPAAETIGRKLDVFIPERLRLAHARFVESYAVRDISGPEPISPRHLVGLRGDGTEFPMEASISRMGDGDEVQMTVVLRDVSGAREAEASRVAAVQADASNRAKSAFLSRMSHELRTPLNAVLGFSQLLREGAKEKLDERECRQLDLIFLAGAQLRALVDDVLDVSGIESGQLSLTLRDFDLVGLLDGVVRMSETAAREGNIVLLSSMTVGESLTLRTDPVRLRQVVLNLVSNAIKYNQPGGSVAVGFKAMHGKVRITVRDTGMGMTEAQLGGLFQPFNRLGRETSEIAGSGIGMALVRQLVELLGGSISVQSESGVGTVVEVDILRPKLAEPLLVDPNPSNIAVGPDAATEFAPSGLVVYIEDNPVNVILVDHILRRWPDVQLMIAEDGASGIVQAAALLPDVLLLDMQLPDMSGLAVLRALRANARTKGLRVIALSASTMREDVDAAKAAGALDYWTKPIDVESFCEGIKGLLRSPVTH